jgi:hypothetical protein
VSRDQTTVSIASRRTRRDARLKGWLVGLTCALFPKFGDAGSGLDSPDTNNEREGATITHNMDARKRERAKERQRTETAKRIQKGCLGSKANVNAPSPGSMPE